MRTNQLFLTSSLSPFDCWSTELFLGKSFFSKRKESLDDSSLFDWKLNSDWFGFGKKIFLFVCEEKRCFLLLIKSLMFIIKVWQFFWKFLLQTDYLKLSFVTLIRKVESEICTTCLRNPRILKNIFLMKTNVQK